MDPKTLALIEVWKDMRSETMVHVIVLDIILLVFLAGLVSLIYAGFSRPHAMVLAAVIGAAFPYVVTRQEVKIHRMAPAVSQIENLLEIQGWENHYKPQTKPLSKYLGILDGVLALFIAALFGYAVYQTGELFGSTVPKAAVIAGFWAVFLTGVWWFVRVLTVAKQLVAG